MGSYKIEWKQSATNELKKLPLGAIPRILKTVAQLSTDPHPLGVRKLVGSEHTYRLRVGVYRIVYSVMATELVIEIIRVKHRKDVYR